MTPAARRWLILFAVALAARVGTFGNPAVHVDEAFYFTVARRMWDGAVPYVDLWDRKPVGLFLLFMPAAALPMPWGILAYQALALAAAVATAALVACFAERAGWRRGATAAGVAYILWLDVLNGAGGQAPVFYNLPMGAAGWLVATRSSRRAGVAAMALVGVALQIKYSVVAEGVFFGLWLLAAQWRRRGSWPVLATYAAALIAVAVLPTLVAVGVYALRGEEGAWLFANVVSILYRGHDAAADQLRNAGVLGLLLGPLIAMAVLGRREARGGDADVRRFVWLWLGVAVVSVALFGGWYEHYGLPVALPGAVCAAGFCQSRYRRVVPALFVTVAALGQVMVWNKRFDHGDGGELNAIAHAIGAGPGTLWVYSGETTLYGLTGRPAPTRYIFPSHLSLAREAGAIGVDQAGEVRRILATRPAVIVMASTEADEEPAIHALVSAAVAHAYRPAARLPMGRKEVTIYRRR